MQEQNMHLHYCSQTGPKRPWKWCHGTNSIIWLKVPFLSIDFANHFSCTSKKVKMTQKLNLLGFRVLDKKRDKNFWILFGDTLNLCDQIWNLKKIVCPIITGGCHETVSFDTADVNLRCLSGKHSTQLVLRCLKVC